MALLDDFTTSTPRKPTGQECWCPVEELICSCTTPDSPYDIPYGHGGIPVGDSITNHRAVCTVHGKQ